MSRYHPFFFFFFGFSFSNEKSNQLFYIIAPHHVKKLGSPAFATAMSAPMEHTLREGLERIVVRFSLLPQVVFQTPDTVDIVRDPISGHDVVRSLSRYVVVPICCLEMVWGEYRAV